MNLTPIEAVNVLTYLVPGFVAGMAFYSLTSYSTPRVFDRVIHALIFTIIGKVIWENLFPGRNPWELTQTVVVTVFTVAVAVLFAWISNNDMAYRLLRLMKFTKETSHPSEWYSVFSRHSNCYVVLHLSGQRRLYGWPEEWPGHPEQGHFGITEAAWLREECIGIDVSCTQDPHISSGAGLDKEPADRVSCVLVPAKDVEMVEFLKMETTAARPKKRIFSLLTKWLSASR